MLDALKEVAIIETKIVNGIEQVVATDGDEGFYIYELNGKLCDQTVDRCMLKEKSTVVWKKLEPVAKLRINIEVED